MNKGKSLIAGLTAGLLLTGVAFAQGGRGGRGASGPAAPGGRGGRAGGFTQYTRPLASQDILVRGQSLYDSNCSSCHAKDLRGVIGKGNNVLRLSVTMNDKQGELVTAALKKHTPAFNLVDADSVAIAEYIHSILAKMGGQGSPPRSDDVPELNILVGDAKAGEAYFAKNCTSCHSLTGDMKGIASKYADARALQNGWVGGTLPVAGGGGGRGGGRGGGAVGSQATVTMANGQKFEGRVVRKDDFLVILTLADGTRKSFPLDIPGVAPPKVEVKDANAAHKEMAKKLDDPMNKNMHDVTAFLATLK